MRHLFLACLLAVAQLSRAEVIDIDNKQLDMLSKRGVPVIDIRLQAEWEETGILAGSRLQTFFDEKGQVDTVAWLRQVKSIAKPDQALILICRSGNRSRKASEFLSRQAGYTTVYNVRGGIRDWIAAGGQLLPAMQSIASCKAAKTC